MLRAVSSLLSGSSSDVLPRGATEPPYSLLSKMKTATPWRFLNVESIGYGQKTATSWRVLIWRTRAASIYTLSGARRSCWILIWPIPAALKLAPSIKPSAGTSTAFPKIPPFHFIQEEFNGFMSQNVISDVGRGGRRVVQPVAEDACSRGVSATCPMPTRPATVSTRARITAHLAALRGARTFACRIATHGDARGSRRVSRRKS